MNDAQLPTNRRAMRSRRVGGSVAALAAVALFTGCSTTSLNTGKLEKAIVEKLKSGEIGAEIGAAKCPASKDVKVEAGGTFECTVDIDGSTLHVGVTQTDKKGNVEWKATDAIVSLKKVEDEVVAGLKKQIDTDAKVDCGGKVARAVPIGETFECEATALSDESKATIVVTAKDTDGNVDWVVKEN